MSSSLFLTDKKKKISTNCKIATQSLSDLLVNNANDLTVGLLKIQEHAHETVPKIMKELDNLENTREILDISVENIREVQQSIRDMDRINSLGNALETLSKLKSRRTRVN
jgi:hypothetical protein